MTLLTQKDYREYLIDLKNRVYKILPLYEELSLYKEASEYKDESDCLSEYIDSVTFELYGLRKLIGDLPHGLWYVKSLATLEQMKIETLKVGVQKKVKKEIFKILKLIDNQIDVLKGE